MKIERIEVKNFKAIKDQSLDLNGCSIILTGGNNKGKSSLLTGLIKRMKSVKPGIILNQGSEPPAELAESGHNIMTLTDGAKIEWKFTKKSESFAFITPDGFRQTSGVIGSIGERYFGKGFDVEKFLHAGPKAQLQQFQDIIGLDFSKLDQMYKEAYQDRADVNRDLKKLKANKKEKPEKVEKPNVDFITQEYYDAVEYNKLVSQREDEIDNKKKAIREAKQWLEEYPELMKHFHYDKAMKEINGLYDDDDLVEFDLQDLQKKIAEANKQLTEYNRYEQSLKEYNQWVANGKELKKQQEHAQATLDEIEKSKRNMISKAKLPEGFTIDDDVLLYNGFPFEEEQISTSAKYIGALKLGSWMLGEVETLHFEASALDNDSLAEVNEWAEYNNLQLMIEYPDKSGGEIKYEIVEHK